MEQSWYLDPRIRWTWDLKQMTAFEIAMEDQAKPAIQAR